MSWKTANELLKPLEKYIIDSYFKKSAEKKNQNKQTKTKTKTTKKQNKKQKQKTPNKNPKKTKKKSTFIYRKKKYIYNINTYTDNNIK